MLRRGKANLEAGIPYLLNLEGVHAQVAPRFQQAESNVLSRAHTVWECLAKQAALFDQLSEQVGNRFHLEDVLVLRALLNG